MEETQWSTIIKPAISGELYSSLFGDALFSKTIGQPFQLILGVTTKKILIREAFSMYSKVRT